MIGREIDRFALDDPKKLDIPTIVRDLSLETRAGQCCSRVLLKRISGKSCCARFSVHALRARNTGPPSRSSAIADPLASVNFFNSSGSSADTQRAVS